MRWVGPLLLALAAAAGAWWHADRELSAHRSELRARLDADPARSIWALHDGQHYRVGELRGAAHPSLYGPASWRSPAVRTPYDDPVAAIVDFRDRLAERGVDLWVLPAPLRTWVAPQRLRPLPLLHLPRRSYAGPHDDLVDELRGHRVEVVDLLPDLQRAAASSPDRWTHPNDPHWTGHGVVLAAERLAEKLRRLDVLASAPPEPTMARWRTVTRNAGAGGIEVPKGSPDQQLRVRTVRASSEEGPGAAIDVTRSESPLVIIGDSHVSWYDTYQADLGRQLAHETQRAVDTLPVVGGGSDRAREELARREWAEPGYLAGKELVIWVFWADDLFSRAWHVVPLDPTPVPRLEAAERARQVDVDVDAVVRGRGLASFDHRWAVPPPESRDEVSWVRKPLPATVRFRGRDDGQSALIVELDAKKDQPVLLTWNGRDLGPFELPPGRSRLRLPSAGPSDEQVLVVDALARPDEAREAYAVGLHRLSLVHGPPLLALDGPSSEATLTLPPTEGEVILRLRARSATPQEVDLRLDGQVIARGLPFEGTWQEHAIRIPGPASSRGRVLEIVGKAELTWSHLEIDPASP